MLFLFQQGQAGLSLPLSSAVAAAYWNPSDKATNTTLSNSNKTAASATVGPNGVRSISSQSSGKWYFEVATDSGFISGNKSLYYSGIFDSACSLTTQPIFGALGGKYACTRFNSQKGGDGGSSGASGPDLSTSGVHVVGFAADFSTRTLSFYLDNVAKTSAVWGSGAASLYAGCYFEGTLTSGLTLRVFSSEFTYSPPSGYSAWGGS